MYRLVKGEPSKDILFKASGADMMLIEKKGDSFIVKAAKFGEIYEQNIVQITNISESALIGFFVCSGSVDEKEAAAFSNIRFFNDLKPGN